MCADQVPRRLKTAFTLRELLVTVSMVTLLALVVAPGPLQLQRREAQLITCVDWLERISQAVAFCFAENNDYGPTHDDGEGPGGHISYMLTWTDLLYDMGYLPNLGYQLCPADEHPDAVAELRGERWEFLFVDHFGVNEPPKFGVRTSYALNMQMSANFTEDRFEDPSRQVYALDGWWCWTSSLNAAWLFFEQIHGSPPPHPVDYPHWEATTVGWRHGLDFSANVLYLDGHVGSLTPHVPEDPNDLLTDTVDTMQSFTWLPGERNCRYAHQPYHGELPEYYGRLPYWTAPEEGTFKNVEWWTVPIDFPEYLSCRWRTANQAWLRLPNDPQDRR